jgi:hypothetical protein
MLFILRNLLPNAPITYPGKKSGISRWPPERSGIFSLNIMLKTINRFSDTSILKKGAHIGSTGIIAADV